MSTSVEVHRALNSVIRKYQDTIHQIRVILNPDVLKRLKCEGEELLVEWSAAARPAHVPRRPRFHSEKFIVTDANTGAELKV